MKAINKENNLLLNTGRIADLRQEVLSFEYLLLKWMKGSKKKKRREGRKKLEEEKEIYG